jgi:hypothetical protein
VVAEGVDLPLMVFLEDLEEVVKEEALFLQEQETLHQQVLRKEIMEEQDHKQIVLEEEVEDLLL